MAMIACPHCGEMVSETASNCTYCYGDLSKAKEQIKKQSPLTNVTQNNGLQQQPELPEEVVLFRAYFKMPIILHLIYILLIASFFIVFVSIASSFENAFNFAWPYLIVSLFFVLIYPLHYQSIKRSNCTITNKRIYGVKKVFIIFNNDFCHRIEKIDKVETTSFLGLYTAKILFTPATGLIRFRRSSFKLSCLENYNVFYDSLSKKTAD